MNNIKKDFVWTSLYNGIMGTFSSLMLLICVRLNGTTQSGKFIIILTTITIISTIGEYGIGLFQVTDVKRKYKFGDYFISKIFLLIIMVVVSIIYLIFKQYSLYEILIFMFLLTIKIFDSLSSLYQGELQLQKKLFLASKYAFCRVVLCILVFVIIDVITKNLVLSSFYMMISNILLFIIFDLLLLRGNKEIINIINKNNIKGILKQCFPLFFISILNMYIINFTKYILDIYEMYELQTYYNIIYITMFILNLLVTFLIKPLLEPLTSLYEKKDIKKFIKYILLIFGILCIFALLLEIVFLTFGTNLISIIYGVNINIYKNELCIMIIGSLFYAITTLLQNILTIMRKQKKLSFVYIIISLLCLIFTCNMKNVTMSAIVWLNNFVMFILILLSGILVFKELNKSLKN